MNVVVIPHIKSKNTVIRGKQPPRKGTDWIQYSINTWKWWCAKHNVQLEVLETNYGGLEEMPYTYQRWCSVPELFKKYGDNTKLAFVDGDTMIRWDTPNFFDMCPEDSITVTTGVEYSSWRDNAIKKYQLLFPEVELPIKNYYNIGFVVLTKFQLNFIEEFVKFIDNNQEILLKIQLSDTVGTDQTPFNFILRKMGNKVNELPDTYNWMRGFPDPQCGVFLDSTFNFIEKAYVWHFTPSYRFRDAIMSETWKRIAHKYQ